MGNDWQSLRSSSMTRRVFVRGIDLDAEEIAQTSANADGYNVSSMPRNDAATLIAVIDQGVTRKDAHNGTDCIRYRERTT